MGIISMIERRKVTCLVPTYNRPEFLRRLLTYFATVKPEWTLLIADSSNNKNQLANQAVIGEFADAVSIVYKHFDSDLISKCRTAFGLIETPFVVMCADDDFVSPGAVDECVEFLSANSDYSVCQGVSVITSSDGTQLRHKVELGFPVEADDVCDRLGAFSGNWFAPFYGVYRTRHLHSVFDQIAHSASVDRCRILAEFLQSFLVITDGKLQVLRRFFAIRQSHETNACAISPPSVSDADFAELAAQFRDCLLQAINRNGLVNPARANQAILSCQSAAENAIQQWKQHRPTGFRRVLFEIMRPIYKLHSRLIRGPRVRFTRNIALTDLTSDCSFKIAERLTLQFPSGIPLDVDVSRAA